MNFKEAKEEYNLLLADRYDLESALKGLINMNSFIKEDIERDKRIAVKIIFRELECVTDLIEKLDKQRVVCDQWLEDMLWTRKAGVKNEDISKGG